MIPLKISEYGLEAGASHLKTTTVSRCNVMIPASFSIVALKVKLMQHVRPQCFVSRVLKCVRRTCLGWRMEKAVR